MRNGIDLDKYERVEKPTHQGIPPYSPTQPGLNSFLRSPLPPISNASPDNLRQYYSGGAVPQTRVLPLATPGAISNGGTTITNATIINNSGGSSSSVSLASKTVSLTTPTLTPNQQFLTSVQMAKSFQLLSITANSPAEVRVYGSSVDQINDSARGLDIPPAAGVPNGIITDVGLDTSPYQINLKNRIGNNSDASTTPTAYVTVVNLSSGSAAITVNLTFVPIEQP